MKITVFLSSVFCILCGVADPCCSTASGYSFAGGTGEPNDPYQIATAEQLCSIGSDPNLLSKSFVLVSDIDLDPNLASGAPFGGAPIAPNRGSYVWDLTDTPFTGVFDGNGHVLRNLTMRIETPGYHCGLFGRVDAGARVLDLRLENALTLIEGYNPHYGGILAGWNSGEIRGCSVQGRFMSTRYAESMGGVVGYNEGVVEECSVDVAMNVGLSDIAVSPVSAAGVETRDVQLRFRARPPEAQKVGVLAGYNGGRVAESYATGSLHTEGYATKLGGLVGWNEGLLKDCYAAVRVDGVHNLSGGLAGSSEGAVLSCYFLDPCDGGGPDNGVGVRLGTEKMGRRTSFAGWDFAGQDDDGTCETWTLPMNGGYPVLNPSRIHGLPYPFSGRGTAEDPYLVSTRDDLMAVNTSLLAHYRLAGDIDLGGVPWGLPPIVTFRGHFDGAGHVIGGLVLSRNDISGLFGIIGNQSVIEDLIIMDSRAESGGMTGLLAGISRGTIQRCHILRSTMTGQKDCNGGLVGVNDGGNVVDCSTRQVSLEGALSSTGGLVGYNGGTISGCSSEGAVRGNDHLGGLVGYNTTGSISGCRADVSISGKSCVGGLVGEAYSGSVSHCYSAGDVAGVESTGGLMGSLYAATVTSCYSVGKVSGNQYTGGLIGHKYYGSLSMCVWDIDMSGQTVGRAGIGLSTAEMMDPLYLGLNGFADDPNWVLEPGRDYPRLAREGTGGRVIPDLTATWTEGKGTEADPFRIPDLGRFVIMSKAPILWDRHFVLLSDVDLRGMQYQRAVLPDFAGTFDGHGFGILGLTIEAGDDVGLFGRVVAGAVVQNLRIIDASVIGSGDNVGMLAGSNAGTLTQCSGTGMVRGADYVGGLVGTNSSKGTLNRCSSRGAVFGEIGVGGLLGQSSQGKVYFSYSTAAANGRYQVAGLIGHCSSGEVVQTYSAGKVAGSTLFGGLVGDNNNTKVSLSLWDTQSSGLTVSGAGTGKTTAEMTKQATFADWDFNDVWTICEGKDYPRLGWEKAECTQ